MRLNFKNTSINDVEEVSARVIGENNDYLESFGDLRPQVKFKNIFVVSSSANTERGQHAHLRATQYLFCLSWIIFNFIVWILQVKNIWQEWRINNLTIIV